jgi:hypothetical protein
MVYFKTKNPIWGKSWSVLQWMRLVNCMAIWSKLLPFRIFHGHLVYFVFVLVYMSRFGMLYQENMATLYPTPAFALYRPQHFFVRKVSPVIKGRFCCSALTGSRDSQVPTWSRSRAQSSWRPFAGGQLAGGQLGPLSRRPVFYENSSCPGLPFFVQHTKNGKNYTKQP